MMIGLLLPELVALGLGEAGVQYNRIGLPRRLCVREK